MENEKPNASEHEFINETARQLGLLFKFARRMNELDFAGSLSGEFRGMQDAGWSTTITAEQVFDELVERLSPSQTRNLSEIRIILLLYSQLAEAGGVYETLKNMMGVIDQTPYLLWPFKDLVKVTSDPKRVIGPNANATFRDLARHARKIGMIRLSESFERVFRDDIRNAMFHSDYILWDDGLRLRRRNGGRVELLTYEEVSNAVGVGVSFFQAIREMRSAAVRSFDPPRTILGRFSANFPMPWTVEYEPQTGGFSISGSSPGPQTSPEYERQETINNYLGGHVLAVFMREGRRDWCDLGFTKWGFAPAEIDLPLKRFDDLINEIEKKGLWDTRNAGQHSGGLLALSPWGFRTVSSTDDIISMVGEPEYSIVFEQPE